MTSLETTEKICGSSGSNIGHSLIFRFPSVLSTVDYPLTNHDLNMAMADQHLPSRLSIMFGAVY